MSYYKCKNCKLFMESGIGQLGWKQCSDAEDEYGEIVMTSGDEECANRDEFEDCNE